MIQFPHIPRAALGPILLVSVLVLLVFGRQPPARPILAPPSAVGSGLVAERPVAPGQPTPTAVPLVGNLTQLNQLEVVSAEGLFNDEEKARLAAETERALRYVEQRFETAPTGRISAYFGLEPACGIHGIAYTAERTTQVFTCHELPISRAVNIMAHELVHQLCHDRYGDRHLSADLVLLEGTATWGAGDYWLSGSPNFRSFVQPWLAAGQELPLGQSYVGLPISSMNQLYYQWASFVEFLIEQYGRPKFDQVYVTGSSDPGSSDYSGVYGKRFDELEAEWKQWVLQ